MLRMTPIASAHRVELYYARSDGGYYHEANGLRSEWGGKGAERLGLEGTPEYDQFKRLIHGLDPHTGAQLTAKLVGHRIPGWDVTCSVPKGVTVALERGDSRIQDAIWQAGREAMGMLEGYATTRVRKDGQQADRRTGNLLYYAVEHAETRPVEDTSLPEDHPHREMPDMDRHLHFVIPNLTYDAQEDAWKAVKFRPLMDVRRFFDRSFESLLAKKMADLGYEVETKWKRDDKGTRYYSWDIKGIPESALATNSRRSAEVKAAEAAVIEKIEQQTGQAPEELSTVARDGLGATSRRCKRGDVTLADCRTYWDTRFSDDERRAVAETIKRALRGENPKPKQTARQAVAFALLHHGEQRSVTPFEELAATAMERCLGAATPAEVEAEVRAQGLVAERDGRLVVTTEALQAEEAEIVRFAQPGLGVTPVGVPEELGRDLAEGRRLNDGQWQAVVGLLESPNRINLVEGPAGAGKSSLLAKYDQAMRLAGEPVTYAATTAKAVEVLEHDGFAAHTVQRLLVDEKLQEAARGGRVVVDEVSMLGHADTLKLVRLAEKLDLKLVLVGDAWQHGSVPRGAVLRLLKEHAHLKPFRLTDILRQQDADYRQAAKLLSEGKTLAGLDILEQKGWVHEVEDDQARYAQLAQEYVGAVEKGESVLCVSPTHAESSIITQEIRAQLRTAGKLGEEERAFVRLVPVNASEAQKGEATTYRQGDLLLFHQNAKGGIRKGTRLVVGNPAKVPLGEAAKFSIYRPETIRLSRGDRIRFTGTVRTLCGEHTLKNGTTKVVAGFDAKGNLKLDNGWVVAADAGLFRHAFVETSFGAQGQTHQRVILGMGTISTGAMSREQLYVSATRGKQSVSIYTDDAAAMKEAVARTSQRLVALDLPPKEQPKPPKPAPLRKRLRQWLERRRHLMHFARVREAWGAMPSRPAGIKPPARVPAPATRPEISYTERLRARQADREHSHGR